MLLQLYNNHFKESKISSIKTAFFYIGPKDVWQFQYFLFPKYQTALIDTLCHTESKVIFIVGQLVYVMSGNIF